MGSYSHSGHLFFAHKKEHNPPTRYVLDSSWIMQFAGAKLEPIQCDGAVMIYEKAHSIPSPKRPSDWAEAKPAPITPDKSKRAHC
jgi:hypothetical protein